MKAYSKIIRVLLLSVALCWEATAVHSGSDGRGQEDWVLKAIAVSQGAPITFQEQLPQAPVPLEVANPYETESPIRSTVDLVHRVVNYSEFLEQFFQRHVNFNEGVQEFGRFYHRLQKLENAPFVLGDQIGRDILASLSNITEILFLHFTSFWSNHQYSGYAYLFTDLSHLIRGVINVCLRNQRSDELENKLKKLTNAFVSQNYDPLDVQSISTWLNESDFFTVAPYGVSPLPILFSLPRTWIPFSRFSPKAVLSLSEQKLNWSLRAIEYFLTRECRQGIFLQSQENYERYIENAVIEKDYEILPPKLDWAAYLNSKYPNLFQLLFG